MEEIPVRRQAAALLKDPIALIEEEEDGSAPADESAVMQVLYKDTRQNRYRPPTVEKEQKLTDQNDFVSTAGFFTIENMEKLGDAPYPLDAAETAAMEQLQRAVLKAQERMDELLACDNPIQNKKAIEDV